MTRKRTTAQFLVPPKPPVVETITRYAITHVGLDGLRTLTLANQGRNHYDSRAAAEDSLVALEPSLREKVLGDRADTLQVRPVECWENGDAVGIYFDADEDFDGCTDEPRIAGTLWRKDPYIFYYVGKLPGDGGADWGYVTDMKCALPLTREQQKRFAADTRCCGRTPNFYSDQIWSYSLGGFKVPND